MTGSRGDVGAPVVAAEWSALGGGQGVRTGHECQKRAMYF